VSVFQELVAVSLKPTFSRCRHVALMNRPDTIFSRAMMVTREPVMADADEQRDCTVGVAMRVVVRQEK